jgi:hypothetical protein
MAGYIPVRAEAGLGVDEVLSVGKLVRISRKQTGVSVLLVEQDSVSDYFRVAQHFEKSSHALPLASQAIISHTNGSDPWHETRSL